MDENTTITFEGFKSKEIDIKTFYALLEKLEKSATVDHCAIKIYPSGYLGLTDEPFCIGVLVLKRSLVKKTISLLSGFVDDLEAIVVCNETRKLEWFQGGEITQVIQQTFARNRKTKTKRNAESSCDSSKQKHDPSTFMPGQPYFKIE